MSPGLTRRTLLLAGALLPLRVAAAAELPVPPCAGETPRPAPPRLGQPPAVLACTDSDLLAAWQPPACLGWRAKPADVVLALAARFRLDDIEALLARFTAISALTRIRYWSVTREAWRPLFLDAVPLSRADPAATRGDFRRDEIVLGEPVHVLLEDDLIGAVVHSITVEAFSPELIRVAMRNVLPGGVLGMEVLPVDGLEMVLLLEREEPSIWRYWSIMRATIEAPDFMLPSAASYANRAAAIFRYVASLPTDAEPPLVRRSRDLPS
ncbi:MAG: hypothetical protein H6852_05570 [Geminicoccaceae bacterium]|nr:hypothetical protein [Geminicoccaceae bacterium]HRY23085.1 hypothetical protein [Geminicoccaceae bacterium]